jgi:hypothetical protein
MSLQAFHVIGELPHTGPRDGEPHPADHRGAHKLSPLGAATPARVEVDARPYSRPPGI